MGNTQRQTKWKVVAFGIGILVSLILLVSAGGRLWLTSDHARHMIQARINEAIPGTLSWDELNLSIFAGRIEVTKPRLQGPAGEDLVSLDRVFVKLSWTALFRKTLAAETVILDKPRVWLATDPAGELNILKAFPASTSSEPKSDAGFDAFPFNIRIDELALTDGFFQYEMQGSSKKVERIAIHNIELTVADGDLFKQSARFSLLLKKGEFDMADIVTDFEALRFDGRLQQDQIKSIVIQLDSDLAHIDMTGGVSDLFTSPFFDVDMTATPYLSHMRKAFQISPALTGPVRLHLKARGRADNPEARLSLAYQGGEIAGTRVDQVALACSLKEKLLVFEQLEIKTPFGRVAGTGEIDLQKAFTEGFTARTRDLEAIAYRLNLTQTGTSLKELPGFSGKMTGEVQSTLTIEGVGISPETLFAKARLEMTARNLAVMKLPAPMDLTLTTRVAIENNRITVHHLDLGAKRAKIEGNGSWDLSSSALKANLALTVPDLSSLRVSPAATELTGQLTLNLGVRGSMENPMVDGWLLSPEANLTLTGRSLAVGEHLIGNLDACIRLNRGVLSIDEARLQNGQSNLTLSGTARLLDADTGSPVTPPSFDVNLAGKGLYLEDFIEGMQGRLILNGCLQGDAAHPIGTLSLKAQKLDLGVQKIHDITLNSILDKDRVTVDSLKVSLAPGEELTADGWISLMEKQYALSVSTTGIHLKNIESIGKKNAIEGKISLNVTGTGSLENPRLNGEMRVTRLRLNNEPFDDGMLKLTLQDHIARIEGDLVVALTGQYHLKTQAFSIKAILDQTRLEPFFKIGGRSNLTGTLTGLIEAEGNAASPETIRVVADLSQLFIYHNETALVNAGVCNASFENGTLLVPNLRLTFFHQGHLEITGEKTRDGSIDFKADGAVPLEVIHLFTEALSDITGEIKLAARLKGTLDHPDLRGNVTLDHIGLTVPVLGQQLHTVNGRIELTPEALTIETLTGNLDKGRFDLSGELVINNFAPVSVNARLNAHALPVTLPETLEVLLNGELTFSGTPAKSRIAGDIILLEGRYFKDVKLGLIDSISQRKREAAPATRRETTPLLKNTDLNITIRHRSPFIVDNNMALMALKPTLTIYGPLSKALVNGRAEVESGIISYLGKEFQIKKGVLDFLNPYKVEATIDLDSQIKVRKWTINLKVSGVEDNLKFEMSSTPEETDADILSLIVFNKTRDEMISGEGGSHKSTKQLLADMVTRTLEESLKEATGLDTLEMTYTERTDKEDADDVSITVGKELSKRITLKYGVGTKNGVTVQSAITEYKFYENVMMNAFRDTDGDFGGELIFRLEMR